MKTIIILLFVFTASCLLSKDRASVNEPVGRSKRDLTLIANPAAFPPSAADLAKIRTRVLRADQAAAVARIAAIEARMRQIREDSEARIRALTEERGTLIKREREISEALKDQHQ